MKRQNGSSIVEFAFVGGLFFMLLFGIIEVGRALYVWNTLTEATRRATRVAVVSDFNDASILSAAQAVFPPLTSDNVKTSYLDENGTALTGVPGTDYAKGDVYYVEVKIADYTHTFFIPYVSSTISTPEFKTVLPRESLGEV